VGYICIPLNTLESLWFLPFRSEKKAINAPANQAEKANPAAGVIDLRDGSNSTVHGCVDMGFPAIFSAT
jgi:hypothetical protein